MPTGFGDKDHSTFRKLLAIQIMEQFGAADYHGTFSVSKARMPKSLRDKDYYGTVEGSWPLAPTFIPKPF